MKMTEATKVFLLGVIACALVLQAGREKSVAWAGGDSSSAVGAGGLLAVTGSERATLFLIDPAGQYFAQYAVDSNNRLTLKGARYFKYDLQIGDLSRPGLGPVSPEDARKEADGWLTKLKKLVSAP